MSMESHRLTKLRRHKQRELFPGIALDSLTLSPYSSRFILAEGAVEIDGQIMRVGTLLSKKNWLRELEIFFSEVPTAHHSWTQEISLMKPRGRR